MACFKKKHQHVSFPMKHLEIIPDYLKNNWFNWDFGTEVAGNIWSNEIWMDLHGLQCFQQNYPETFLHELVLTARNLPAIFSRKIPGWLHQRRVENQLTCFGEVSSFSLGFAALPNGGEWWWFTTVASVKNHIKQIHVPQMKPHPLSQRGCSWSLLLDAFLVKKPFAETSQAGILRSGNHPWQKTKLKAKYQL